MEEPQPVPGMLGPGSGETHGSSAAERLAMCQGPDLERL